MNELTAQSEFGAVRIGDGVIVIRHHEGGKRELTLPVAELTAVEFVNANVLTFGYIRFLTGDAKPLPLRPATSRAADPHTMRFARKDRKQFARLREHVDRLRSTAPDDAPAAESREAWTDPLPDGLREIETLLAALGLDWRRHVADRIWLIDTGIPGGDVHVFADEAEESIVLSAFFERDPDPTGDLARELLLRNAETNGACFAIEQLGPPWLLARAEVPRRRLASEPVLLLALEGVLGLAHAYVGDVTPSVQALRDRLAARRQASDAAEPPAGRETRVEELLAQTGLPWARSDVGETIAWNVDVEPQINLVLRATGEALVVSTLLGRYAEPLTAERGRRMLEACGEGPAYLELTEVDEGDLLAATLPVAYCDLQPDLVVEAIEQVTRGANSFLRTNARHR